MTQKEKARSVILREMYARGLTYEELAVLGGVSDSSVKRIAHGDVECVGWDMIISVLEGLGYGLIYEKDGVSYSPRPGYAFKYAKKGESYAELLKFIVYLPLLLYNTGILCDVLHRLDGCLNKWLPYFENQIEELYRSIEDSSAKRYADLLAKGVFLYGSVEELDERQKDLVDQVCFPDNEDLAQGGREYFSILDCKCQGLFSLVW